MLVGGILNPAINSLLSRVRHTNCLLISDRGFPSKPGIETIDLSLVADIPRVTDVLRAVRANFSCGRAVMSSEFQEVSSAETKFLYAALLEGVDVAWESHIDFKVRSAQVIGIIRTGDTTRFGNIILEST